MTLEIIFDKYFYQLKTIGYVLRGLTSGTRVQLSHFQRTFRVFWGVLNVPLFCHLNYPRSDDNGEKQGPSTVYKVRVENQSR